MVEIYNYNYSNIYLQTIFFPFPLIRHSYENEQHAIQGCKSPSRKCMTYSWRRQPTFVQYNPLSPLKGAAFCKACNKSFKHYKGTVHNSLQKSRVLFKMRDLLKKKSLVQDAAVISRSAYPKLCFHAQNVLFPCKCLTDYWYCFQEGSAATLEGKKYGLCLKRV